MKKFKLFNVLLILSMILLIPNVYAHDIDLDGETIIIPEQISSNTKIQIDKSYGEYNLYYQYVKMDAVDFEQYQTIEEEESAYIEDNKPSDDATEKEQEEYYDEIVEYEASKKALKPGFVESDWINSADGKVPFKVKDGITVEEGDPFVLWVKITKKTGEEKSLYNEKLIIYSVDDEVQSPSTSDNVLVIGILAVAAFGIMTLSYKKVKA